MQSDVKSFLYRVVCGFLLGLSVVAPGLSASVMAVMMGIYRRLIDIVSNPFKDFKRNFFYLLPMGIGALISCVLFIALLARVFQRWPAQAQMLFMGLIAGGLWEVFRLARRVSFRPHHAAGLLVALALAVTLGLFGPQGAQAAGTHHLAYLCLAGAVAGVVSVVPGMSVSMILMLFGVYEFLLQTASSLPRDFLGALFIAVPVGVCFLVGMVLFSRVIKLVFDRHPGFAYYTVLGFMAGTLVAIAPALPPTWPGRLVCGLLALAGLGVSLAFQRLGGRLGER